MFPNDFSFCETRDWVQFIFVLWGPRKLLVHHCRCIKCLLISSWGDEILSHSPLSTGRCSYQWEWPNSVLCFKDISSHMNKIYGAKRSPDWCGSSRISPWMQSFHTRAFHPHVCILMTTVWLPRSCSFIPRRQKESGAKGLSWGYVRFCFFVCFTVGSP